MYVLALPSVTITWNVTWTNETITTTSTTTITSTTIILGVATATLSIALVILLILVCWCKRQRGKWSKKWLDTYFRCRVKSGSTNSEV